MRLKKLHKVYSKLFKAKSEAQFVQIATNEKIDKEDYLYWLDHFDMWLTQFSKKTGNYK